MSYFDQYAVDCFDIFPSDEEEKLQDAAYYLSSIVKRLYNKETPVDLAMLESELDSLCDILDVAIGDGELQITQKSELPQLLRRII